MDIAHEQRFFLYWLITRRAGGRMEALTVRATGRKEEVLPVFGFEEEARMFVHLAALGDAWRVRQTSAGEIISLLYGPCASVIGVVLDPVPSVASDAPDDGFLGRREFLRAFRVRARDTRIRDRARLARTVRRHRDERRERLLRLRPRDDL